MTSLIFNNISFSYNKRRTILEELKIVVNPGDVVGILGPNGSGKTTLLKLANGLLKPNNGSINLGRKIISEIPTSRISKDIAFSFQLTRDYFFTSSVKDELLTTIKLFNDDKELIIKKFEQIVNKFKLTDHLDKHPYSLSGGEKKRLSLAILSGIPATYFLFDEPTANLDKIGTDLFIEMVVDLKRQNRSSIIVSHNPMLLLDIADHFIIINEGKTIFDGSKSAFIDVLLNTELPYINISDDLQLLLFFCRNGRISSSKILQYLVKSQLDKEKTLRRLLDEYNS